MSKILSPLWEVFIGGSQLVSQKKYIQSVTVDEAVDGSNTCTIEIIDDDGEFVQDNVFMEDSEIRVETIWMPGNLEVFDGYISAIDIDFPEDGLVKMSVFCLDGTHKMNMKKRSRTFENCSRADAIRLIAQEYGFGFEAEAGFSDEVNSKGNKDGLTQSKQTDIEFIESLAEEEGTLKADSKKGQEASNIKKGTWRAKLIDGVIQFSTFGSIESPVASFDYKSGNHDILSFQPKLTASVEEGKVEDAPEAAKKGSGKAKWKVTLPDSTVKMFASYKEAQKVLDEAVKKLGNPPPVIKVLDVAKQELYTRPQIDLSKLPTTVPAKNSESKLFVNVGDSKWVPKK